MCEEIGQYAVRPAGAGWRRAAFLRGTASSTWAPDAFRPPPTEAMSATRGGAGRVASIARLYRGRRVAFLTQHGKERVVAPVLRGMTGCVVERVTGYDTDLLGSFTRDIPRAGTQIEAAGAKARTGMALAGLPLGLGSEGSFALDPFVGLFPWNVELLVFRDDVLGIEVAGMAQGRANSAQILAASLDEAERFARAVRFPQHHLVVRPDHDADPRVRKGITNWAELRAACGEALRGSSRGRVFIEVDLRAHANPTRLTNIRLAALDCGKRLRSFCPRCRLPGFGVVETVPGWPCADCGAPTRETRAEIHGCVKCGHRVTREREAGAPADPARCDYCNP